MAFHGEGAHRSWGGLPTASDTSGGRARHCHETVTTAPQAAARPLLVSPAAAPQVSGLPGGLTRPVLDREQAALEATALCYLQARAGRRGMAGLGGAPHRHPAGVCEGPASAVPCMPAPKAPYSHPSLQPPDGQRGTGGSGLGLACRAAGRARGRVPAGALGSSAGGRRGARGSCRPMRGAGRAGGGWQRGPLCGVHGGGACALPCWLACVPSACEAPPPPHRLP